LRKITIEIDEERYLHFLCECNVNGLTIQEQIEELINYYVIVQKKRLKSKFSQLKMSKF